MDRCNVLIIIEDLRDIKILSEAFKGCGVDSVHYVHSALQAFMYLEGQKKESLPKLIIADLNLPGISGAQFRKDLKEVVRYKHIPVVVLSTLKKEQDLIRFHLSGEADFVVKPTTPEEYITVANSIIKKASMLQNQSNQINDQQP